MTKKKKKRNLLWKVPQIIFRKCFITLKYKEGEVSGKKCLCVIIGLEACWLSGKESACQCRRHRFDPWVVKIPGRRKSQCAPVFLPGKSHGQRSLQAVVHGVAKGQMWLSTHISTVGTVTLSVPLVILSTNAFVLFFFTLCCPLSTYLKQKQNHTLFLHLLYPFLWYVCVTRRSHNSRIKETWY